MYAPRGKVLWPNAGTAARWQSTGSPTSGVAEEKLGSLMVQRRRVPAGTTVSCARAVGEASKDNNDTATRQMFRRMVVLPKSWSDSGREHGAPRGPSGKSESCLRLKRHSAPEIYAHAKIKARANLCKEFRRTVRLQHSIPVRPPRVTLLASLDNSAFVSYQADSTRPYPTPTSAFRTYRPAAIFPRSVRRFCSGV